MLRMKDIVPGDCWRFRLEDEGAPDHKPTVTVNRNAGEESPEDLPSRWDHWEWEQDDMCEYMADHGKRPIELLEHYSVSREPTPLKLRRKDLKPGDCFQYIERNDFDGVETPQYRIVDGSNVSYAGFPGSWDRSTARSSESRGDDRVHRVLHWSKTVPKTIELLASSECGKYVVIASTDIPRGARRSQRSATIKEAVADEATDIEYLRTSTLTGPGNDGYCWVARAALTSSTSTSSSKPAPVVLSCIDPFRDLRDSILALEKKTVDGIKGAECLVRFEKAQQTESLARPRADMNKLVCTNAECGLTAGQVEHARQLWSLKLRLKVAEQAAIDATRAASNLCDDPDEMPNMVYVAADDA